MARSDVFHYGGLTHWSPLSDRRVESLLDLMPLPAKARVLDVGCGQATLLLRLVERYGVSAVGIDRSADALALARAAFAERAPEADVEFQRIAAADFTAEPGSFDAVCALGGPHLGDGLADSWRQLTHWVRPGGSLLLGEGFWQAPPPAAYLEVTGIPADSMLEHWQNIAIGRDLGLHLLYCCVSSRAEWDAFEGRIMHNFERRARDEPGDEELAKQLQGRRRFFDAQQRYGRTCMGFGVYLFDKPHAEH